MADKRVRIRLPDGQTGTIPESQLDQIPEGAHVFTAQELAEQKLEEDYAKKSAGMKIAEALGGQGIGPTHEAFLQSGKSAFTGGVNQALTRKALDYVGPKDAGKKYAEHLEDLETGEPGASTAGTVAGTVSAIAAGMAGGVAAGGGAARLLPANVIGAAGAPIEHGVARALGGLAAKGTVGRAATTAAGMAVRGVAEGVAYSGLETATSSITHDTAITGEKLYGATGHGALLGGGLGAALGFGGSLVASGARGIASRIGRSASKAEPAIEGAGRRRLTLDQATLDAGITESPGAAESPIKMFGKTVELRSPGRGGTKAEPGIGINERLTIDPDAGLPAPQGKTDSPFSFQNSSAPPEPGTKRFWHVASEDYVPGEDLESFNRLLERGHLSEKDWRWEHDLSGAEDAARVSLTSSEEEARKLLGMPEFKGRQLLQVDLPSSQRVHLDPEGHPFVWDSISGDHIRSVGLSRLELSGDVFKAPSKGEIKVGPRPARNQFHLNIDPDAGLRSVGEEAPGLKMSKSGKAVRLDPGGMPESLPSRDVISLEPPGADTVIKGSSDPIRKLANEQAWKAVGGGFGLQSTRYAKEAAKYFGGAEGTSNLGEIAMRYGAIDLGDVTKTPFAAGWQAAKSGTPASIAPKLAEASDMVGAKIGAITEASGARVALKDVDAAFAKVRAPFDRIAGNEHVVNAIDNYQASLRSKLTPGQDGAVRLQDLLEQRKGLDQIVYQETKTLDPGRRVAALREVRGQIEGLITDALDAASSKVPGAERAAYTSLKRDYHGLRILTEVAEDSAARASKGATLGLGEKFALASSIASGNFAAAPVLAVGGKFLRERGNAAAAAFLHRHADLGTFENIVNRYNAKLKSAAAGVINERPKGAPGGPPKPESPEAGKRAVGAVQSTAKAITQWVGDFQTNPKKVIEQVQDTAANVSRAAGSKAAESYTANTMRAIAFISAHIPVKERRDPLDPRSTPALTFEESDRLVRATRYALKPETIFDDFERGIVTPEGIRAAKTFQAESFVEFQLDLQKQVTERIMRGQVLSQSQRLKVDRLLGYGVSRPETIQRLQTHFAAAEPPSAPPGGSPAPAGPPISMNVQQSGFDAVEARMTG